MKVSKINFSFKAEDSDKLKSQPSKLEDPMMVQFSDLFDNYQLKLKQLESDYFQKEPDNSSNSAEDK